MASETRSITGKLITGTGWNLAWRVVTRSLGFVSVLAMAQLLVPADLGIVAMAASISASIDALSQLGVREALVRLKDHDDDMYSTAFSVQVVRAVVTALILLIVSVFAQQLLGDIRMGPVMAVYAFVALIGAFENIGLALLTREMDFRAQFILQVVPRVAGFVVTLIAAFVLRNYWAIIIGAVVARVAWILMSYAISPYRPRFGKRGWRYLLHFSFWSWLNSIFVTAWNRCDPFLLGPIIGAGPLGIFMLAAELAMLPISELLDPICAALFPGFAMAQREGSSPAEMGLVVAAVLMLGTMPFAIALSATSGFVVAGLLGHKWDQVQPLLAILTWACVFSPFSYVSGVALSAQGEVRRTAFASGLAALVKVAILLIVRHQPLAVVATAIVAIVAAESVFFLFQLSAAGNLHLRRLSMTVSRGLLAGTICCAILYFVPGTWRTVEMSRVAALITGGTISVAIFGLFGALVFVLWYLFGQPDGAEKRAFDIIRARLPVRGKAA